MKVSGVVLNAMLDNILFDDITMYTYNLIVVFSSGESDPEPIEFVQAGSGALNDGVTQLSSSVFFPIVAGTTVTGIKINAVGFGDILTESIPTEDYTDNGTFTVNNIIATLTAN